MQLRSLEQINGEAFVANALLFTRLLRSAGLPLSLEQSQSFLQALTWIDLGQREQVFHTARALLVTRAEHVRLFTTIFNRFWRTLSPAEQRRQQRMPRAPRHKPPHNTPFTVVTYMAYKARLGDPEIDITDKSGTASTLEVLQRKDFSELNTEELQQIKQLIADLHWQISQRETRRRQRDSHGEHWDRRATLRDAARFGGVPRRIFRQRQRQRPRPLILIADISGSMEKYSRLLLQFLYSLSHALPRVETFVFGTRLTRITSQLKLRNIDQALDQAAREVVDWAGGTRIGASLQHFNRQWARRVLGRGAVVLLISDGWEQGDPVLLSSELRFLQRRCHRLIWLNPLLGRSGYQPRVGGMQAALAHIDDFLPMHNFASLINLAERLKALGKRSSR